MDNESANGHDPAGISGSSSPPPLPRRTGLLRLGTFLVVAGVVFLLLLAAFDGAQTVAVPWGTAVLVVDGEPLWDGTITARARHLALSNFPEQEEVVKVFRDRVPDEELEGIPLDLTENVVALDIPRDVLEPVLASGRLPEPGEPEVLAGAFTRLETFTMDDIEFQVVGRLNRSVAGLYFTYTLPYDESYGSIFDTNELATRGWFDPQGLEQLAEHELTEAERATISAWSVQRPASPWVVFGVFSNLLIIACGGAIAFRALIEVMYHRDWPWFRAALAELFHRKRLYWQMHALMYGAFFLFMAYAAAAPYFSIQLQSFLQYAFSQGDLGYIGAAYQSGNVLLAAAATFVNNYFLQTVILTILISFFIPCVGILKTLMSFLLAGGALAPLWSGSAARFSYHSITMVIELEAYILACIAVAAFWIHAVRAIRERSPGELTFGLRMTLETALLTGIVLAVAAIYEAFTLIVLTGGFG